MLEHSNPFAFSFRVYSLLTKPGIIFGNVITTGAGFALASHGSFSLSLFLLTVLGIALVIGASCVYNNYIDRQSDKKMERTKNRPLASGAVSEKGALFFATTLLIFGMATLGLFVNGLAMLFAIIGFVVYVFLYSFSKYQTTYGTLIGSIAGAMPPLVGYSAASGKFDLAAFLLFASVVLWQMPHFYAISIRRLQDYEKANIPILPLKRGMLKTKLQMFFYILGFSVVTLLLTAFNFTSYFFMAISSALAVVWLILCIRGIGSKNDLVWAKQMFLFSLVVIMGMSFAIPF